MSFPRYPEYKSSGVEWFGEVPGHWTVSPLKRLIERNDGGVWGDDPDGDDDTIVLRSTEQTVDGRWKIDEPARRKLSVQDRVAARLAVGDLLITKSSGSSLHIGKATLVTDEIARLECCYSNFMQRIRMRADFDARLAWHILNNEIARTQFDLASNSTTGLANLNGTMIGEVLLAVPPPPEQTAIAAFLDRETGKIDALVAEQEKLIALLKEKCQAVISYAVTKGLNPDAPMKPSGIEWLGDVPTHWRTCRLGDICAGISTGPFGTALGSDDYVEDGIPVINPSHIENGRCTPDTKVTVSPEVADRLRFWRLQAGDVITARRGELGRAAIVTDREQGWICGTGSLRITPRAAITTPAFLYWVLQSTHCRTWLDMQSVGSTMPNLSEAVIARLPLAAPPSRDEQTALVADLEERLASLIDAAQEADRAITLLKERRSALISAAVTGQIDVRGEVG